MTKICFGSNSNRTFPNILGSKVVSFSTLHFGILHFAVAGKAGPKKLETVATVTCGEWFYLYIPCFVPPAPKVVRKVHKKKVQTQTPKTGKKTLEIKTPINTPKK